MQADRSASGRVMSFAGIAARFLILLGAWVAAWIITPQAVRGSPWASFSWWTTMKALVWFGLGAVLFRPAGHRAWVGSYRGRIGLVLLLGATWAALDTAAVHIGLRPPAVPPTMRRAWNAWLNVLVIAPVLEELLFRGLFWSAIEASGTRTVHAWTLSAGAFAALHLPGWIAGQGSLPALLPQLGLTFTAGLLCGSGRWLTGSVWPAVLLHFLNNAASVGVFYR